MKWHVETRKVSELKGYEHNPRVLTKKGLSDLKKSIDKFGLAEPIVINTDNVIIGGHARTKVLKPTDMVDVYVPDKQLSEQEYKELNVRLNKNIAGEWDFDILANAFELPDLLEWGFDEKELKFDLPVEEDEAPEVDEVNDPITKLGDIYQLGEHRLMCGDATDIETVTTLLEGKQADLVFTDPPYWIDVVKVKNIGGDKPYGRAGGDDSIVKAKDYSPVIGDETTETARKSYEVMKAVSDKHIIWGGNYFTDFLPVSRCWLIWNKEATGTFADGEIAWSNLNGGVRIYKHMWSGLRREGDRKSELSTRVHPTQKPVGLHGKIMQDFGKDGDSILGLFGGSGSTLIACEQLGRKCYMMELDPRYCDVIVKRWEQFTGMKAEKITESKQS